MTTLNLNDPTAAVENSAQVLRRTAAAVRVHFTWMGTRRTLTRAQKDEAAEAFGAEGQFLSAGKKLIDTRHGAFRKLTALRTQIGQFWKGLTLPYVEPGVRLIRQDDVEHFAHVMAGYRAELTQAETELNAAYTQVKHAARQRLGRLYNDADYTAEIRGLFGVEFDFPSVEPPSYLMQLHPEIYRQEQQRIAHRFEEAVQLAEQSFISELAKLVSHLTERLAAGADGNCKVFRDSAVGNLQEFFAQFRRLNIHSNAQLDQLVEQAQQIVRGVRPQELRDNDALRQQIATQLTAVQSTLDGLLVDQPRRRIVRAQPQGGAHAAAG